jgi:branched-chain amino acid transport system permease protein
MSLDPPPPPAGQPPAGPQVGADEWVARQEHRREYPPSLLGDAQRLADRIGWWRLLALAGLAAAALPLILGPFQLQVGIDAMVIALLAVGLNITVGWTGLLDLGYVAFFGCGAYGFALVSSGQVGTNGIHLPSYLSIPLVMLATAALGVLVGLPSRRLVGDYLAIITLFFGEAFVEFTNNVAPNTLGGPNGIVGIDPISIFGHQITTNTGYYYLLVVVLVVTMAVLRLLEFSRTGRAWRAVREDPLAAGSMTIPVDRVKLMAFAFGAAVAALAGTIFAAQQISVFPTDFDTPFLILIYAGLILGGAGSIAGAATGALLIMVIYDGLLRSPTDSGYVFYGLILLTLVVKLRPWKRLGLVLAATVALGLAVHAIAAAISPSAVSGSASLGGPVGNALHDWVVVPANATVAGNWGFVALICLLIALVQVSSRTRTILLPPTLYLAAFVWETTLSAQPAVTRQLMIGAILIVMMNARPQGLLGQRRVEAIT